MIVLLQASLFTSGKWGISHEHVSLQEAMVLLLLLPWWLYTFWATQSMYTQYVPPYFITLLCRQIAEHVHIMNVMNIRSTQRDIAPKKQREGLDIWKYEVNMCKHYLQRLDLIGGLLYAKHTDTPTEQIPAKWGHLVMLVCFLLPPSSYILNLI